MRFIFGKTFGCCVAIVKRAWDHAGELHWWVAPTFGQSKNAYNLCRRLLPKGTFMEYKADLRLVLLTPEGNEHSFIEFKSADNPDSLRGFGVNYFVMDEAARCPYESFISLFTTITQTNAPGIFISTPHARNWFFDIYQWGEKFLEDGKTPKYPDPSEDKHPEWLSLRLATWANPTVPLASLRQMKSTLPEDVFRQEVAALFLADSAGVFRGVRDVIRGSLSGPIPGHSYVLGVDLGKLKDFTVLTVMDRASRNIVYQDRFNKIAWAAQYSRIIACSKHYNAPAVMDSTGIGDPIVETVKSGGICVIPYKIGGSTAKHQLIDKLRLSIERENISIPSELIVARRELEAYEYSISMSGVVKYSAPSNGHDDCVVSIALANWECDKAPFRYQHRNVSGV